MFMLYAEQVPGLVAGALQIDAVIPESALARELVPPAVVKIAIR